MNINLEQIAEIITEVTGIRLEQMRFKNNSPDLAEARHLFLLVALKYGNYKRQYELTEFINASQSTMKYAQEIKYRQDIVNQLRLIEPIIQDHSSSNMYHIHIRLNQVNNTDKIILVNNIINQIPAHQRQFISL